ncbi:MAG: tellurite resistance TerB family protein [Nitratireductor sp.]|nr:tellurite resistance TerB family protein [Nitratireductor sp.]
MFDAKALLDQVIGTAEKYAGKENIDKLRETAANNPTLTKVGAIGAAGVLLSTGAGRNILKLGALAGIGGLAYKTYQDWQANQGKPVEAPEAAREAVKELAPPPAGTPFDHATDGQDRALAFLTAMIAAAKADGEIDKDEQQRIFGKVSELVQDREARAFLMDEMMAPLDIDRIVALAKSPEQAVELYTASAMAIEIDTPAEREYLNVLADRLGLEKGLTGMLETAVADERRSA